MEPSRKALFWLVALLFAVHNREEAMMMPHFLEAQPEILRRLPITIASQGYLRALMFATLIPLALAIRGQLRPHSRPFMYFLLLTAAIILINVASHAVTATAAMGDTPGLAAALAFNLPASVYVLRRGAKERWASPRAMRSLLPLALCLHGPALWTLLVAFGAIRSRF